ncbi:MAG: hypothetical protein H6Q40_746 [Deltaproteobacteria bacterium]|nr:hypothetical protein [Deltaproteobacteria bacterium]
MPELRRRTWFKEMRSFRVLDHTADIGIAVNGRDLKTLFENAGHAFFHLLTDLRKVRPRVEKKVEVGAESLERMMVDWLSELLYLHDVEQLLFKTFKVESIGKDGLRARVAGEPFQKETHVIKTEIKAVTYHQIRVAREKGGWTARIIFDL